LSAAAAATASGCVQVRLQVAAAWEAVVCIALAALLAWAVAVAAAWEAAVPDAAAAGVKTVAGALPAAWLSLRIRQPTIGPLA
jgi:hypothetical protein